MNAIHRLNALGQSIWLDNIERQLLTSGELQHLIFDIGVTGVTSNPSIFEKAISGSADYDAALTHQLALNVDSRPEELFFALATEDIQAAADLLRPVHEASYSRDGYVSLEVSPALAYDSEATIEQALTLVKQVNRTNLMIKVPATKQGLVAIERLTAAGVSINATLLFSVDRYREVAEAYMQGLETRLSEGHSVKGIASVASFFISRVDSAVDAELQRCVEQGQAEAANYLGKTAIANAKLAYQVGQALFDSERFEHLQQAGAQVQRLLWASTGAKNPSYSDVMYIDELIGTDTVNTVPPKTMHAFLDHGEMKTSLTRDLNDTQQTMIKVDGFGIDLEKITAELEQDGVRLFSEAFDNLLSIIRDKADNIKGCHQAQA